MQNEAAQPERIDAPALRIGLAVEAALLLAVALTLPRLPVGLLTAQMIAHIAVTGGLALILAGTLISLAAAGGQTWPARFADRLGLIAALQLALFALFHAPGVHHLAMTAPGVGPAFLLAFALVATGFWTGVIAGARSGRIKAVAALLLTGKAFCLLALLMLLAERALYGGGGAALADQQGAGLVMLIVCPLVYVGAGTVIVARWLTHLGRVDTAAAPP